MQNAIVVGKGGGGRAAWKNDFRCRVKWIRGKGLHKKQGKMPLNRIFLGFALPCCIFVR